MEEETETTTAETEYLFGGGGGGHLPFPRGGPIYIPDLVGPITSVIDFKAAVFNELKSLEAEVSSAGDFDDALSVNELKVYTEEELVEKAVKEEFEDILGPTSLSQVLEHASEEISNHSCILGGEIFGTRNSETDNNLESSTSLNNSTIITSGVDVPEESIQQRRSKKRGRLFDRNTRAAELEGSYLSKVRLLAKFKEKQDEDKLAARLHSYRNSEANEGAITTCKKTEKMRSLRFVTSPVKVKSIKSQEHVPLWYPEVVLCVEIYDSKRPDVKKQEFLVLGSQSLSDLRDSICCFTDRLMQTAEEHDPSGYFLIEDTFCNDLRDPNAIDYSEPIFNWIKKCNNEVVEKWDQIISGKLKKNLLKVMGDVGVSAVPSFKAVLMHKTRFSDLRFRLGARYLYCHQGNCKHNIVIRDMRLIHPEDAQNMAEYPLLTFQLQLRNMKCSVCQIYLATKVTVDDKWSPRNPCYYCINCYFLLHYKEDNSLLFPHVVFDYYHE